MTKHPFQPNATGRNCSHWAPAEGRFERCSLAPDADVHTGTRPAPPELEPKYPDCSICGEEVGWDERFYCDPCGANWGDIGREGNWDDPDLPICGATAKPFDRDDLQAKYESIRHNIAYCGLPADHDGNHREANAYGHEWEQE